MSTFRCTLILLGFAMLFALAGFWLQPRVTDIKITYDGHVDTLEHLPFTDTNVPAHRLALTLETEHPQGVNMLLASASCIRDIMVNSKHILKEAQCENRQVRKRYDLSPYLMNGTNAIVLSTDNPAGLLYTEPLFVYGAAPWDGLLKSIGYLCAFAAVLLRLRLHERFGLGVCAMLMFSLMLALLHYYSTSYYEYSYDGEGHAQYITYMALHFLPPPPVGWHYSGPPLYYTIAALFYKAGELAGMADPLYASRFFSLLLYSFFLVIALLTLQLSLRGKYFVMAASLLLFWPDMLTWAGRISNDMGMLVTNTLTLYFATRWHERGEPVSLKRAWAVALAGLLIKGNGIIAVFFMGLLSLLALWQKRMPLKFFFRHGLVAWALFCLSANFGRTLYYRVFEHMDIKWLVNLSLGEIANLLIKNTTYLYVYFDIGKFIAKPFVYDAPFAWGNIPEDVLFWDIFFKTLLFGEINWHAEMIAQGLCFLLVLMLGFILAYVLCKPLSKEPKLPLPAALMALSMIAAVISVRLNIPWATQANARYAAGFLVIFILCFLRAVEWNRLAGRMTAAALGFGIVIVFDVLSVILFVQEYLMRMA